MRPSRVAVFFAALAVAALPQDAAPKKILTLPVYGPTETFDPHARFDQLHLRTFAQIYEAPLGSSFDARGRLDVVAGLCDLPEVSEDRKTIRLKTLPGARFHDHSCFDDGKGRAATAIDVAASLLRHADPDVDSPYYELFVARRFVGVEDWRESARATRGADYTSPPRGIRAEGDVVVLELTEPYPALRALLTQPWASVLPIEAIRRYGRGVAENAVGTGPFRFADQDAARLRLVRHANYRVPGKPAIDELRFAVVPDAESRLARFIAGDLDAIDVEPRLESKIVDRGFSLLKEHQNRGRELVDGVPLSISYLAFNCGSPLFEKTAMRRAITASIDRGALAKALFGPRALRADAVCPPTFRDASTVNAEGFGSTKKDPAAASAALKEAGYASAKDVPEFQIDIPSDGSDPRLDAAAKLLADDLGRAGFRTRLRKETFDAFLERSRKNDFALAWLAWYADYPDAENFAQLFRSDRVSHAGFEFNYGRFSDEIADRAYVELASRLPGVERLDAATRLFRRVRDEAAWIPIAYPRRLAVVQKGVSGVAENLLDWSLRDARKDP
jgi:oligopeptide transport system substrate-binding protein